MPVMPLLFWLASCGADPSLEPPNGAQSPAGQNVLGQRLLSPPPVMGNFNSPVAVGQPVISQEYPIAPWLPPDPVAPGFVIASPDPTGIHRTHIYDLIDSLNPWTPTITRVVPEYYDPFGWQASYGTNGYQPWRLGWTLFHELAILPNSSVSGGTTGSMQIGEWNSNLRLSELIAPGVLFNATGYFNARYWSGPGGIALGPQVDQISADLELGFFNSGPWSGQIAFHPQIVDGYRSQLNRNAFNFDGRAVATYLASPNWSFVAGAAIWDRVDLMVVPHVGVIWTPDTRWEVRLLYPRTRISYYLGQRGCTDFWVYGVAEYTAEAWQANIGDPTQVADRIQITDDRVSIGLRWDSGRQSVFIEAGYVFNRQAKFAGPTPDFDISNCGMLRAGVRF